MYCEQIKYQTINLLPLSEACLLQLLFKRNKLTNVQHMQHAIQIPISILHQWPLK